MSAPHGRIRLRGVRQNNLKNIDLDLPLRQLIVIAGLSGSGKSSLAFDTLFAEGQRRYVETFSPYARQFLDRMDKPQADSIEGIPPAIAIEQRNSVKSTRSTVGTMTEIADYAKIFWASLAQLHCKQCGQVVRKDSPQAIWPAILAAWPGADVLVTFDLPLSEKFPLAESLALIGRQGYRRLLVEGAIINLEDAPGRVKQTDSLTVVQDRVAAALAGRRRFMEAVEQAYHFGKGRLTVRLLADGRAAEAKPFSNRLHCATCDIAYREPSPALFSFNHPVGACAACRGFGRTIAIDFQAAIPDWGRTLAGGAVKPWQTPANAECQDDLLKFARAARVPVDVPFAELSKPHQEWVVQGDPHYNADASHRWPKAWYGIKGYFRWLESRAYKMHVRVLLSRYRIYEPCVECRGARFQAETLLYRLRDATLAQFYQWPIQRALEFVEELIKSRPRAKASDPVALALDEARARLGYLQAVGLGYLTLDRLTRTLSGGETERVNLTACLGSRLVNTLFVLDEPSVGLHPRDTARLARILEQLRDAGNTVAVVEHEPGIMRVADQIVELGPGHGADGGAVVFQGSAAKILRAKTSLTGHYLSGRRRIAAPPPRPVDAATSWLTLRHASLHNLRDLTARIPLGRFVCLTGVSGSGKTTLARDLLLPALQRRLSAPAAFSQDEDSAPEAEAENLADTSGAALGLELEGWRGLGQVVSVDQSALGRTPRSNPAVYIGAFDEIRNFFAQTEAAKQRGLNASAFSFNSSQGQCERCRGVGFEKIEMQFLSDIFIRCPDCNGRRYRSHILKVTVGGWSIADLLEAPIDGALEFLQQFPDSTPGQRAAASLRLLQEVGLGYLRVGQPINTLSGGESQRLKLISHLAKIDQASPQPNLFVFDEPTTGLHFADIELLLKVFQRLVQVGHSVLVVEHNLEVIKCADWVVDMGPEAGDAGGQIVAEGTPETIAKSPQSHTGAALRDVLSQK
ncbi:MAG TPA: excinuclease ABC subunit UvrA [Verrucomicrobiae bacterium]|jgi:excinuclease ABC subunit A|nr:excinuclease ABC subunit UvrA [Verrucomicrobiae bacterium]